MTNGIAHPGPDTVSPVGSVEADNPEVVNHFHLNDHGGWGLKYLVVVVVEAVGEHRRAGVASKGKDTALT